MPIGRPPKYCKEMDEIAYQALVDGHGMACDVAVACDISTETVYAWIKKHKSFSDAISKGKSVAEQKNAKIGLSQADGSNPKGSAAAWIFLMKNTHKWTDKTETDLKVSGDDNLLAAIARGKTRAND